MAGTASSGRPGGNPDLVHHQYKAAGDEPLIEKITIRITTSMLARLQEKENFREFIRQAIQEKFDRDELHLDSQ